MVEIKHFCINELGIGKNSENKLSNKRGNFDEKKYNFVALFGQLCASGKKFLRSLIY